MTNGERLAEIARQARADKREEIKNTDGYKLLIKELEQTAALGKNYARILSMLLCVCLMVVTFMLHLMTCKAHWQLMVLNLMLCMILEQTYLMQFSSFLGNNT